MKPNLMQLRRLVGNPDVYAVQHEDGSWTPVRKPLSNAVLLEHLSGTQTVGTYINVADHSHLLVFDLDEPPHPVENLVAALVDLGVPKPYLAVEESGRKGYHIWLVLQNDVQAKDLRRLGRAVLALSGVTCEVFPKQDEVRDLGNLVKLPGGIHRVTGNPNNFLGAPPRPMPVKVFEDVLSGLPEERARMHGGSRGSRFPCITAIQDEGAGEGSRNIQLFHLATMFRRHGATDETVELVVRHVNEKNEPPLDEVELQTLLNSSTFSGPICEQLPAERHCPEGLCIKDVLKGLSTRPGAIRNGAAGDAVVVVLDEHEDDKVTFTHEDLLSAKGRVRGKAK